MEAVAAINIMGMKEILIFTLAFILAGSGFAQNATDGNDSTEAIQKPYKKRVLETVEIDFLTSFYGQKGQNAAVTGGRGTEELTDVVGTIIIAIPLNADEIIKIDAGISTYTSASSSNINPFNGDQPADPFIAASGESSGDTWKNIAGTYMHYSDDRNKIWSAKLSLSTEYDYKSVGLGGSYTQLFNEKNTEISISANVFLDNWKLIYPVELNPGGGDDDEDDFNIANHIIWGDTNYNPQFTPLNRSNRNSYSLGLVASQILTKRMQGSIAVDAIYQNGLLSTPFQRVYFADKGNSYIENFHLADDIERLPGSRFKIAIGGKLNYYINEFIVVRSFYRYYFDDWGVKSHTASIEFPIKIGSKWTVYPSYRYYFQKSADYFAPYNQHLSTDKYYTSDYDLSQYSANQFGFGVTYKDIFTKIHIWKLKLKSISLNYNWYQRNTGFNAHLISAGVKFTYK